MIQSLLPSPGAALGASTAAPLDALLQLAVSLAETPDFAALLAQSAVPVAVSEGVTSGPAVLPADAAEPAPAAKFTAQPGNPLPPPLPDIAARLPPPGNIPAGAEEQPAFDAAQPASLQIQLQAAPPARSHQTAKSLRTAAPGLTARTSGKTDPLSPEVKPALLASEPVPLVTADPPRAEPQLAFADQPAIVVPALLPAPAPGVQDAPSEPAILPNFLVKTRPSPVPANPDPAPQAIAHAAPQAAFLRALIAPIATQTDAPVVSSEVPQNTAPAANLLRVEIAMPGAAEPAVKALEKFAPAARRAIASDPLAPMPASVSPDSATLLTHSATPPPTQLTSPRPHDFAAVVDRLVAAREAVQPQAATLTVAHAEFGPVELRFRHEERGLAVALTSADPDFARAAAVAAPLNLPASAASFVTAETSQSAVVRDNASAAGGSAGGQPRGQQSERRGDAAQQSSHGPRGEAARDATRRSGIFA